MERNIMRVSVVISLVISFLLSGCATDEINTSKTIQLAPSKEKTDHVFEQMELPSLYDLRKYEGTTLNFLVENNLFANILESEIQSFYNTTGIRVKIHAMDFDTLFQKMNLDFITQTGKYQIVYVDPYRTLNRFSDYLQDLNVYQLGKQYPHVEGFPDDFYLNQVLVTSYYQKTDHLYAIPFDNTTMILYYRKDIFDAYKDAFYRDKGYDWSPDGEAFTWDTYIEIARWIDAHVPDDVVEAGSGHMARDHNSIFCDFSNVMASYGAHYFENDSIQTLGKVGYQDVEVESQAFIQALETYKEIIKASSESSAYWDWTDSAEAFWKGKIAMMPNWDENYSQIEYGENSMVKGKVGYALLPKGPMGSANIFGGSGVGINRYATEEEKEAAWLFIVWATSKEMQAVVNARPEGGMPTRKSLANQVYSNPEAYPGYAPVVLNAWNDENSYYRPKITYAYEFENILTPKLHQMIVEDLPPETVAEDLAHALQLFMEEKQEAGEWND